MSPECLLCGSASVQCQTRPGDRRIYRRCGDCDFVTLDPEFRLSPEEEKKRYLTHQNDVEDPRYQNFVRPLVDEVARSVALPARGLDFGAGTGPVVSHLLRKRGFEVELFDPYFAPLKPQGEGCFDFIVSCEVIEHLYDPLNEFKQLARWLKPNGSLFLMSELWQGQDVFDWYYAKDPTHVCFFSGKNLNWLAKTCGFRQVDIRSHRLIVFRDRIAEVTPEPNNA